MCKKAKKIFKKGGGQTKIKKNVSVKTHLMSRWSQALELSWVPSGQGKEDIWWPFEDSAAKTSVQKCDCPPLTLFDPVFLTFDLSNHTSSSTTSTFSSKCPLMLHTFNMKMENDTHVHSKTTTIREKIVLYLLWVRNTSAFCFVFLVCEPFVHFFLYQGVHSWLCVPSIKAGLRGHREGLSSEDQSVTFQLQG